MDIIEIFELFPDQKACLGFLEKIRWQGKPKCPYCQSQRYTPLKKGYRYHCNKCNTSFRVTVGTIFHRTHLPLQKWLLAISLILHAKKGISARQIARHLKVNRNTAWRISMKIREAMYEPVQRNFLQGIVEMDETYIGPKRPRKTQKDIMNSKKYKRGRGTKKTPVMGLAERYGKVKARVVRKHQITYKKLSQLVRDTVDLEKSVLVTDQAKYYKRMNMIIAP